MLLRVFCLLLGFAVANVEAAPETSLAEVTVKSLQAQGHIRVRSWLEGEAPFTERAMLLLNIEVATDLTFAAGSRVQRLEMPDTIVLRRDKFAVNSTRYEDGRQWTVQLWTVTLYPQRAGPLFVPVQQLNVSITLQDGQQISGLLDIDSLEADVRRPTQINHDAENWLASPSVQLTQTFDRALTELKKGDVVQRTITLAAEDVAAMMLPSIVIDAQPGLAIYQKPSRLDDRVNRGTYSARRVEVIAYVIEEAGEFVLPEVSLTWWDIQSQQLNVARLDAFVMTAQSIVPEVEPAVGRMSWIALLALLVSCIVAVAVFYRCRLQRHAQANAKKTLYQDLKKAHQSGDTALALTLFYRCLDYHATEPYQASVRQYLQQRTVAQANDAFEQAMAAYAVIECPNSAALLQVLDAILLDMQSSKPCDEAWLQLN